MMSKRIYLDIETLPPTEETKTVILQALRQQKLTMQETINDDDLAMMADEEYRNGALHGERGRILTIGLLIEENGAILQQGCLGRDRETRQYHLDEARTLRSFWKLVADFKPSHDLFIGHNLLDFDLPFIYKRSIIHQIKPTIHLSFRRFQSQPIFDTMWEWSCWRHRISLHDLAQALAVPSPKAAGVTGDNVYDLYQQGRHEEIAQYCMRDVVCVRDVFHRLRYETAPPLLPAGITPLENSFTQAANAIGAAIR
ncbi:MAG: ribonuclease H-like domain-containing protein [Acidobacteria bacterium]|nr:ribonuclease H-like domain-containing protein [Acidobacteriota bacterium]